MRTTAVIMILLGLCGAASSAVPDDFRFEIVDGAIVVFGHALVPGDPLPKAGECDDCGPFHSVNLVRSPEGRWILIISDAHLANFDAWIFDTQSKAAPKRITDKRRGRHFTGAEWHSYYRLELSFGGMGYSTSFDGIDRFPIALDNEYLSESRFMIESVEIDGTSLVVTYDTTARGKVREVFYPRVLVE